MFERLDLLRLRAFRFPRSIISYAVWAYHRFALSTVNVEDAPCGAASFRQPGNDPQLGEPVWPAFRVLRSPGPAKAKTANCILMRQ
jgi:hypothetical protein